MSARTTALREGFAAGYQDALRDVIGVWEREGSEAALTYLKDNLVVSEPVESL